MTAKKKSVPAVPDVVEPVEIELPESGRSRIRRDPWEPREAGEDAPVTDDYVTADDRIAAFYAKHPHGRIITTVSSTGDGDVEEIATARGDVLARHTAPTTYTVRAEVFRNAVGAKPDATAHATRSTNDTNPVVAERTQETAETVAISRALRFAGITAK